MSKEYFVGKPNILNQGRFFERVHTILNSGQLTNNGPMVQELEERFRKYAKAKHCIAVANATLGLELVLMSLPEGEVIVPTFTFIATIHAILRTGHTPIFVDVMPDCLANPEKIEEAISKKTSAILPVNLFGSICDRATYDYFQDCYDVPVIFDSAHSVGCRTGNNGFAEVFSLHATKICNGFEGGLITTNDDNLNIKLRQYRNFGYVGNIPDPEGEIVDVGTNAKMSEIHAAAALTNFEQLNILMAHNAYIWACYQRYLPKEVGILIPNPFETSNYSYIVCKHPKRDEIVKYLHENKIFARKYFKHLCHEVYNVKEDMSLDKDIANSVFCLPTGMDINIEDVQFICQKINALLQVLK